MKNILAALFLLCSVSALAEAPAAHPNVPEYHGRCYAVTTGSSGSDVHILVGPLNVNVKYGEHADIFVAKQGMFRIFFGRSYSSDKNLMMFQFVITDSKGVAASGLAMDVPNVEAIPLHLSLVGPNMSDIVGPRLSEMFCDRLP